MKKSLTLKLFSRFVFTITAISCLMLFFSYELIHTFVTSSSTQNLFNLGHATEGEIVQYIESRDLPGLNHYLIALGEKITVRFTVIAPDGRVIADSQGDPSKMENHILRPEVQSALNNKDGISLRESTTIKQQMLYGAMPLKVGSRIIGVLRLSKFVNDIDNIVSALILNIMKSAFIIILFSLLLAYFFSRRILAPINELSVASRKVARGDLTVRVYLSEHDEYQELADNFNHMTSQLNKSFNELSRQKEELNGIISSMQEGLMVLNKLGVVSVVNQSFQKMLSTGIEVGRYYSEAFIGPVFNEIIKKTRLEKLSVVKEVEQKDHSFICSFTYLPSSEDIILICHDITEMKKLEQIKKDFAINVSHELKTPLTSIKGYIETLAEEAPDNVQPYIEKVRANTERLIHIVQDLLTLSSLEAKGFSIEKQPVNMSVLLDSILPMFEQRAKSKGLLLSINADPACIIMADQFLLEQVLINLIDNALKYTEAGGVTVAVSKSETSVTILVADTGVGIPKHSINRVFERFFVVDKSRSRKVGGTGLGLSIVKHIVLAHNGEIALTSEFGKGTEIALQFPGIN